MQPHGQPAPKEMLRRMAFAFCTYVMAFGTPGCIPVISLSQFQDVTKMWLIYFCFPCALFVDLGAHFLLWGFASSVICQGQSPEPSCAF